MYLQGYEEKFLPPTENVGVIDTLYDRYLTFNSSDLEKVDSIIMLYNGERSLIYNTSGTYPSNDGKSMIKAGKTYATNNYSLIAYIKEGRTNPFIVQEEEVGFSVRKPVTMVSDTMIIEEEIILEP